MPRIEGPRIYTTQIGDSLGTETFNLERAYASRPGFESLVPPRKSKQEGNPSDSKNMTELAFSSEVSVDQEAIHLGDITPGISLAVDLFEE